MRRSIKLLHHVAATLLLLWLVWSVSATPRKDKTKRPQPKWAEKEPEGFVWPEPTTTTLDGINVSQDFHFSKDKGIDLFVIATGGERVIKRFDNFLAQLVEKRYCAGSGSRCVLHICATSISVMQNWDEVTLKSAGISYRILLLQKIQTKEPFQLIHTLSDQISCTGSCKLYLLRPYLHYILTDVEKVISLDLDMMFFHPDLLNELWLKFDTFEKEAVMALTYEMQPTYVLHVFNAYRKALNYSTLIGASPAQHEGGYPGYNGGLQLLHLEKMRKSDLYNHVTSLPGIAKLRDNFMASDTNFPFGDQDLYSLIGAQYPHLFHVLPCTWNVQLCRGMFNRFKNFQHQCRETVHVIHNNCGHQTQRYLFKIDGYYLSLKPREAYFAQEVNGDSIFHLHPGDQGANNGSVNLENNHGQYLAFDQKGRVNNIRKPPSDPTFIMERELQKKNGKSFIRLRSFASSETCLGMSFLPQPSPTMLPCNSAELPVLFEGISLNV